MTIKKILIFSIFVISPCLDANAQLYKWIDASGEYHISDRPPLDPESVTMQGKKQRKKEKKIVKKKPDKKIIAWRCRELEDQYENAVNKALRFSTDKSLAASMRSEAENYKQALDQICG